MNPIENAIHNALALENPDERMRMLYGVAGRLNESIPYELAKQIEVYALILNCIGKMMAAAQFDAGAAEAERRRVYGHALATSEGTQAQKEGIAEQAAYPYRRKEAEANAELSRWKNAFYAMQELINAKKQTLNVLNREYGSANGVGR